MQREFPKDVADAVELPYSIMNEEVADGKLEDEDEEWNIPLLQLR